MSQSPAENLSRPFTNAPRGSVAAAVDGTGPISDIPLFEVPRNPKEDHGSQIHNQVVDIGPPHSKIASTAGEIYAPSARRPYCASKLLQNSHWYDPAEGMARSLQQYESLMDQMASVANEAAKYIISSHQNDRDLYSSPSSLDGADEEEFHSTHGMIGHTQEHDYEEDGDPGPSQQGVHTIDIPPRTNSRNEMMSTLVSPRSLYPEGGAAESYYHPQQLPAAPCNAQDIDARKHLERLVPQTDVNQASTDDLSDRYEHEKTTDGVHRAHRAPRPWHSQASHTGRTNGDIEVDTGIRKRSSMPAAIQKQATNRTAFIPTPLPFVETKHGNIYNIRRQPIARKWHPERKRYAAFIACLNTFNMGFQVGIYVS
jgi:hypothetical protein